MSVVTMNLSDADNSMTYLKSEKTNPATTSDQHVYSAKIEEEKKIDNTIKKKKNIMDSTPIADIFSGNDMAQDPMMLPQDPRAAHVYQQQAPMQQAPMQQQTTTLPTSNPMNLTDEQMQAIFVGLCSMIAFSSPVQDKLANFIPTFVADHGGRSNTGLVVTGAVAAVVFYFGKRIILK